MGVGKEVEGVGSAGNLIRTSCSHPPEDCAKVLE